MDCSPVRVDELVEAGRRGSVAWAQKALCRKDLLVAGTELQQSTGELWQATTVSQALEAHPLAPSILEIFPFRLVITRTL